MVHGWPCLHVNHDLFLIRRWILTVNNHIVPTALSGPPYSVTYREYGMRSRGKPYKNNTVYLCRSL